MSTAGGQLWKKNGQHTYLVKESPLIPCPHKVNFVLISTYVKKTHFSFDGSKTVGKGQEPRRDAELGPNPLQVQK